MSTVVLLPLLVLVQAISFGIGIVIIVGAVKMMRLRSHGLATAASALAMLPCGPAWLLGLPMGIWSLVVLNRQNVKAAFDAQTIGPNARPDPARPTLQGHDEQGECPVVQGPAEGSILAGSAALLTALGVGLWLWDRWDSGIADLGKSNLIGMSLANAIYALVMVTAGVLMRRRRARLFGLVCVVIVGLFSPAVVALNVIMEFKNIPQWPVVIPLWLGVPVAIWATVVLFRRDVRAAFSAPATRQLAQRAPETGSGMTRRRWRLGTALMLVFVVLLAFWFGPAMMDRWSNKGVLEIVTRDSIKGARILVTRGGMQVTMIDVEKHPTTYLDPGIYQLMLVSGSSNTPTRPGKIELSSSTVNVSAGSRHVVRVAIREDEPADIAARVDAALRRGRLPKWILEPSGPEFTDDFARGAMHLKPSQIRQAGKVLPAIYQEYLVLEAQHTEQHTNDAGHVVVRINPFPAPIEKLENRLWSGLDAILDPEQQSIARLNLKLDPPEPENGTGMDELVRPGFFGWGKAGANIWLWREGEWYRWKIQTRGYEYISRAPQLPEEYRRLWKEPADNSTVPAEQTQESRSE
jgi:hypothetical protein